MQKTRTPLEDLAEILGGDFTDLRPLGEEGGMSRLFRAHKTSLDVDVVIKRMRVDPRRPADVQREARVMTALRHQFLPRIFDLKMGGDGYCYTVMEYIPGETLRQYVTRRGALNQKQTVFWLRQLCQAVVYMHGQNPPVIHSDIKPENIMITTSGDICLIDFNASLELRDESAEAVAATAGYAAPEQYDVPLDRFGDPRLLTPEQLPVYEMACQAQGMGRVTVRTDLYAVGAVAYFMLTGYNPAPWNQDRISLERYDITLGDPLRQVIERCMELRPAARFSSGKEVLRALDGLAKMDRRYRSWRRSCRIAALAIGTGLILSAFTMLWGWMLLGEETGSAYNDLIRRAQELGDQMDYAGQEELLLQAVALDRQRPEAYVNLGGLLYRLGDYQQAIDLLSEMDPDRTGALRDTEAAQAQGQLQYILASCYYQQEEYEEALEAYRLAAYFCPEEASYQRDLAVCCARLGYMEDAKEIIAELEGMQTLPGDVELVSGEIAYAAGEYENALEELSEAARLSEDHTVISRASLQAAQCCRQLGDERIDQEIEILETASRRLDASENGAHLQLLSETWIRRAGLDSALREESYEQALSCLQELMARGQAPFAVRQNTALVLEYLGRFEEAEEVLLQLQEDFPQDYRPPMRLALLYADREGNRTAGERDYTEFETAYRQAVQLYDPSAAPDSEMTRLEELAAQLGLSP